MTKRSISRACVGNRGVRKSICIVGLGKLGLSMAAAYAKRGFRIYGADVNAQWVEAINRGECPIVETSVPELLRKHRRSISVTTSVTEAVAASDLTFVIVATPSLPDGAFSNAQVEAATREIARGLRLVSRYHLVAITCTVMPGTTENIVKPILEAGSGKKCGKDFGLVYNPEFIALGSVVRDLLNPDFVLVGECDKRAGDTMTAFYSRACENDAPVARLKPVEAEIAKIALNCYCTTKISFANMLAEIAERVPGADARAIADAIGLDSRIGLKYLRPGLGFGGPCFPRDNLALQAFMRSIAVPAPIPEAVHGSNKRQAGRVVENIRRLLPQGGRVAILGLAYKPQTPVIEESQAVEIARQLTAVSGIEVKVYDPLAMENAKRVLGETVKWADDIRECLSGSDVCVIAVPAREFATLRASFLRRLMRSPRVVDCWRCMDTRETTKVEYHAVGLGKYINK